MLVTGRTNSGKTTTLASLLQEIIARRNERIITLEDPIEYLLPDAKSYVSQREYGSDFTTFGAGIRSAMRQDPDILLIGEIRDKETAYEAVEATATGHLVFATVHTSNAKETVRRIVNLFPPADHDNMRISLAAQLSYIFCQQLIPYSKGHGQRTLAMEVMNLMLQPSLRNNIRRGEYEKIVDTIQQGKRRKMLTMDQHIQHLVEAGHVEKEDAIRYAHDQAAMRTHYGLDK